ncbi:hypothetical protein HME9302_02097 [Alteripontixanthobacter maritimus]|uniref:Uncharacterized protein n=1 Tax=Alteripontixanthobacter maritimus TaxID=2161824 RepID=A0A369Q7M3_9SPHN|nr:hypothetical protein [Alteripontixanthobacter maritimus]RDC60881.1 hypothetical protein HME9302_02097 [Alteripontixanthobacter maritimus]
MPSLFDNAVASIRMGVEDFRQQDPDRDISAVRNFYAGVLLLAKEALIRAAPRADPELVIGARLKPVPNGSGGIEMERVGHTTVDFQQIGNRAKDFGVNIDHRALKALNRIRNDMEHHYTDESATAIRAAISKGFPVAASLFRQMDENPTDLLGDAWTTMLDTKDLYDQELREARATLENVAWHSPSLADASIQCVACKSELVEQTDPDNEAQDCVELRCRICGDLPDLADVIELVIEDLYGAEAYIRHKDAGEDGPVYACPACGRDALVEGEDVCANCNEPLDYSSECSRCGNEITVQDFLDGLDGGLCSYCNWQMEKVMNED